MEITARSSSEPTFFGYHGLLTNFLVVFCISPAFKSVKAYIVQVVHVKYNYHNIFHVQ
jgi:hypothetical protein